MGKVLAILLSGAVLLSGCKPDDSPPPPPATERECIEYEGAIKHGGHASSAMREALKRGCRLGAGGKS